METRITAGAAALLLMAFVVQAGAVERYELPLTDIPPVIDGKLDDACWKDALTLTEFVGLGGAKIPDADRVATKAMLIAGKSSLYVGVLCAEPFVDKLKKGHVERDSDVWKDDNVEIFIVPCARGGDRYVQLAVNPAGALWDGYFAGREAEPDMGYDSGAVVKARIGAKEWSVEVEIPVARLPVENAKGPWSFHIARGRKAKEMYLTSLKTPVSGFHALEAFAELGGIEKLGIPFGLKNFSFGKFAYGENCCSFEIDGAKEKLTSAEIEIGGALRAIFDAAALAIQTGTLRLPFSILQQADVGKRLAALRVFNGAVLVQERVTAMSGLPTELLGKPERALFYFSRNEVVELVVPVNVVGTKDAPLKLVWSVADADGKAVGNGETTPSGAVAFLRLYWEKWKPGLYDIGIKLQQGGKEVAAVKQSIRLIPSPWEEE